MIQSKFVQRVLGLLLAALGTGAAVWMWYLSQTEGMYWPKASALCPSAVVIGLTALLFPIDVDELHKKYGITKLERLEHYPMVWKIAIVVALFAGLANLLAIQLLAR